MFQTEWSTDRQQKLNFIDMRHLSLIYENAIWSLKLFLLQIWNYLIKHFILYNRLILYILYRCYSMAIGRKTFNYFGCLITVKKFAVQCETRQMLLLSRCFEANEIQIGSKSETLKWCSLRLEGASKQLQSRLIYVAQKRNFERVRRALEKETCRP